MRDHHATHNTDHIVAAVPLTARAHIDRTVPRPLPVPAVAEHHRTRRTVYALARIDASGRIADHTTTTALHWHPGDTLTAVPHNDRVLIVRAALNGPVTISAKRHIVLPAPLRRRCGIQASDLLFLAADPDQESALICTLSWLDTLLAGHPARIREEQR
jgi:bifunctional DNA-binding transcriptional regulator/antitoxin component of YhaV-PrlF toxin-antitoxin module